jgi:predicted house-cleaning noncanonical NTP pyrophosphatase (MazG superfamily)
MGAKLVRDRMGDIPWGDEDAKKYLRPVRDAEEHMALLIAKLLEEVGELQACDSAAEAVEEIADLCEVIDGIVHLFVREMEHTEGQVRQVRTSKFAQRGGFLEGLVFDFNHYTA